MSVQLFGVGVGPGDSGLLTLKAAQVLQDVDVVFAPTARRSEQSLAASIVSGVGLQAGKIHEIEFPMVRDPELLQAAWVEAARTLISVLEDGKSAAFITLGDPSVYSTWAYLRRTIAELRPETEFEVIPGIMATNAVAARIGFSLVEADERMLVLPLPSPVKELDGYRGLVDCVVLYKIGSRLDELAEWVRGRNLDSRAHIVVGAGLPRERCGLLTEMGPDVTGYLSVAVIYMETAPDSWSRGRHSGYVNAHSSAPSSVDATGRYDDFGR